MKVNIQLDSNFALFARDNHQLTHGPPPSKINEKSMNDPKYSLKTYNGKFLGKLRESSLVEEVLPLSVRRAQKPQRWKKQRTSFCEIDF